jgi:hypothetical protein
MKEEMIKMSKFNNNFQFLDEGVIFSKVCFHCGDESWFRITEKEYKAWVTNDGYIQDVFPHMSNEDREVMISGTHPDCWNAMFPEEDDE